MFRRIYIFHDFQIPQKLCGPAGCGFVEGPEQCIDKVKGKGADLLGAGLWRGQNNEVSIHDRSF